MSEARRVHVVLVHGLFSSGKAWNQFRTLLESDPAVSKFCSVHCFQYESPILRLSVIRRIAEIDDVADRLRTFLLQELPEDTRPVVLVTHSQGGLIALRFLARTLADGGGRKLARIKRIVMYACPSTGSEFFLPTRRILAKIWKHPQEEELRPLNRAVLEAHQTVLRSVVNAKACTDTECHIPIEAYGGLTDAVVPPLVARWVYPLHGVVEGDHFSIIRPESTDSSSYRVLRTALLAAAASENLPNPAPAVALPATESTGERQIRVSVAPPVGQRDSTLQGRDGLIAAVTAAAAQSKVHILAGPGGTGKTRLAIEIAHNARISGRRVWWVSVTRINTFMREVAAQLGASDGRIDHAWQGSRSATDFVWDYLNACPDPWLLVFDNADDPQRLGPLDGPVSDGTGWLREPLSDHGMVIVTSRDRNETVWGAWSTVHFVPPLDVHSGALMLKERAGEVGGTYEQARLLSAELGSLPLALRAAADHVKAVNSTSIWPGEGALKNFESFRSAVEERFHSLHGAHTHNPAEPLGRDIVQRVADISLGVLADRGLTQAAPLLKLLACLNIAPIPYLVLLDDELLAGSPLIAQMATGQYLTVLEALTDLGLIEARDFEGSGDPRLSHVLSLHPLVHGILRDDPDVKARRREYYGLNSKMLLSATADYNPDVPESWEIWDALAPHAIEIARAYLLGPKQPNGGDTVIAAMEVARRAARFLIATGLLGPAYDLVVPIIANCTSFGFDPDDRWVLALRHEAARIALERGEPATAEAELRRVITARERVLSPNHADTLASRHKLARAILEQGRSDEAEQLLRSIIEAEFYVRGPEHSDTLVVRHSLARAVLALGNAVESEHMCRDILQVAERVWSPRTIEALRVAQTLARSLMAQEKAVEAEAIVRQALAQADGHVDTLPFMSLRHTLAEALLIEGRIHEAITELESLLTDRCRVLGPDYPETKRTRKLLERTRTEIPEHPETAKR